jgi:cytochrome oxidase Cu insertion factor (SCO1/SenC/PrrC family)
MSRKPPATTVALTLTVVLMLVGCGSATSSSSSPSASNGSAGSGLTNGGSAGLGTVIRRPIPAALRRLPLTNQSGKRVDLASWPGRTVLLVPFLTLCQDICPLTTGNLLAVQQSLSTDHAASNVQIVELTVDPGRDTPARLAAYAKLTHASWQLVTEPSAELRALQKFFGFYYQKVPEDKPPARDWWTGKPLTYDIDHSDNYFVIDPSAVERVIQDAAPDFRGKLNPKLYKFLDALGRQHLKHAPQPDWTPTDVLNALAVSVAKPLPLSVS